MHFGWAQTNVLNDRTRKKGIDWANHSKCSWLGGINEEANSDGHWNNF